MKSILKFFKTWSRGVVTSIAFYPVFISALFFLLSVFTLYFEENEIVQEFKKKFSSLIIQDKETSRTILSTLIGGILSLTVFSFSMVMVVLNQASTNYSPRLLPGLVSDKRNQLILGFYIGTLIYCMMILISLGAYGVNVENFGLSTMIAALFGIGCVGFFVYFIHSISHTIQINTIIETLYDKCYQNLENDIKKQTNSVILDAKNTLTKGTTITAAKNGYFKGFNSGFIADYFFEDQNIIEIIPHTNQRIWQGQPLAIISRNINDSEIDKLRLAFNITQGRLEDNNSMSDMIKLMEIAVRALSPGVNDPGTAIDVINYLGVLLVKTLHINDVYSSNPKGNLTVIVKNIPFEEVFRKIIQPIRLYAKADATVMYELIEMLNHLYTIAEKNHPHHLPIIFKELENIKNDVTKNISNTNDLKQLLQYIR